MRRGLPIGIALGLSFAAAGAHAERTQASPLLSDPFFDIQYDPATIHYENAPDRVRHLCDWPDYVNLSVYGHARIGRSDYYVVMGWTNHPSGDSFGTAHWIKGNECRSDESNWVLSGVPSNKGYGGATETDVLPGLDYKPPAVCNSDPYAVCNYRLMTKHEEDILRALARDAIAQGERAYGGRQHFAQKACQPARLSSLVSFPAVREELRAYCAK